MAACEFRISRIIKIFVNYQYPQSLKEQVTNSTQGLYMDKKGGDIYIYSDAATEIPFYVSCWAMSITLYAFKNL